ncbi:MAG: GAK system XXXCH domain-containing protein [Thermodesulfobacteriota bacterium]
MGASKTPAFEMAMAPGEAADFFRSLARDLEGGSLAVDSARISLEGFKSVSIGITKAGDGVRVEVRVKASAAPGSAGPGAAPPEPRPEYSTLKRWMKKEFKAIRAALDLGRMPDPDLAESFVADSLLMATYPEKGEEFYSAYVAATEAFAAAITAGDLPAAQAAVAGLAALKRDCHDRYKEKAAP